MKRRNLYALYRAYRRRKLFREITDRSAEWQISLRH